MNKSKKLRLIGLKSNKNSITFFMIKNQTQKNLIEQGNNYLLLIHRNGEFSFNGRSHKLR